MLHRTIAPKRAAPPPAATAAKKACTNYHRFCHEKRSLLPADLSNTVTERLLGQLWRSLSNIERDGYSVGGTAEYVFCKEQRPFLQSGLRNDAEKSRLLGQMWKGLSDAERAKYQYLAARPAPTVAPAAAPAAALAPTSTFTPALALEPTRSIAGDVTAPVTAPIVAHFVLVEIERGQHPVDT